MSNNDIVGLFAEIFLSALSQQPRPEAVESAKEPDARTEAPEQGGNGQAELDLKLEHVQVRPLDSIRPAPENDDIYNAISFDDPELHELARSIKERGIQDPILISRDGYIISGHRRRIAAHLAGLDHVPVRVHRVSRSENHEEFIRLLVEMNSQRIKSASEFLHESLVKIDPKEAHQQIINSRIEKANRRNGENLSVIDPIYNGRRCKITKAKFPLLEAVNRVVEEQREYWPLSDRQIHYRLLGEDAPLIHASKPDSRYENNLASYRALTDILTRGRIAGLISWEAIDDETRPIDLNNAYYSPAEFFREQLDNFLKGYWRNRQQSQPNHIEICIEKLTVRTILQQVTRGENARSGMIRPNSENRAEPKPLNSTAPIS